jgi:hypothetical protein
VTPPFKTKVGLLASAEKVSFADSEADAIAVVEAAEGGTTTVSPVCCVVESGLSLVAGSASSSVVVVYPSVSVIGASKISTFIMNVEAAPKSFINCTWIE